LKDYFNENNQPYEIKIDDETLSDTFFFITIANCSQWGYNVKVAPNAKLDDDVLTLNLCKKPPFYSIIPFGIKTLIGKIETSKYTTFKTSKHISISSNREFFYHIDGDAKGVSRFIEVDILHEGMAIITK